MNTFEEEKNKLDSLLVPEKTFVYVAGPYQGASSHDYDGYFEIDRNISYAKEAAVALARLGIPFFSAHLNNAHFEVIAPDIPLKHLISTDEVFIKLSSALYILEGWEKSKGTEAEIVRATSLGKPVFYFFELEKLAEFWKEN